ncbi:MAG: TauD/TfdA family dioxygenase [Parachlamydia sp.]|nr:TauD/TfdA family dioxygenase [Parachlamydia sp.]
MQSVASASFPATHFNPSTMPEWEYQFLNQEKMPIVLQSKTPQQSLKPLLEWAKANQIEIMRLIAAHGALLLRGFSINNADDFAEVVNAILGTSAMDYIGGEGSRTKIRQGVYTSTEAPPQFHIPLHHELSCTDHPPSYISFFCDIAPSVGTGQTILGQTEAVTEAVKKHPELWQALQRTFRYTSRHPSEGSFFSSVNKTHKTWQSSFQTTQKDEVEKICRAKGFEFKWLSGDWIEVTRIVPGVKRINDVFHFYSQAHLYHSNPRIRNGWGYHILANLLYIQPSSRQYDITFEDGSQVPQEFIYQIYDILEANTIKFDWQIHDALLIDNRMGLHGRVPYKGERRILTVMTP